MTENWGYLGTEHSGRDSHHFTWVFWGESSYNLGPSPHLIQLLVLSLSVLNFTLICIWMLLLHYFGGWGFSIPNRHHWIIHPEVSRCKLSTITLLFLCVWISWVGIMEKQIPPAPLSLPSYWTILALNKRAASPFYSSPLAVVCMWSCVNRAFIGLVISGPMLGHLGLTELGLYPLFTAMPIVGSYIDESTEWKIKCMVDERLNWIAFSLLLV